MIKKRTNVSEIALRIGRSRTAVSQSINHGIHEPTRKLVADFLGIAS